MNFVKPREKLDFSDWRENTRRNDGLDDYLVRTATVVKCDPDEQSMNFKNFLDYVNDVFQAIPAKYRGDACIVLGHEDWDNGTMAAFEIYVREFETEEMLAARKEKEKIARKAKAERKEVEKAKMELETYKRLKEKYEGSA